VREEGKEEKGDGITGEKADEGDGRWEDRGVAVAAVPPRGFAAPPPSAVRCCLRPLASRVGVSHATWVGGEIPGRGGWNDRGWTGKQTTSGLNEHKFCGGSGS
jgi:hypothetical protein